nr:unnamed protein product [Callosobruchus chinensis]
MVVPASLDRHSGVVAKRYPYNDKSSCNWSKEEQACVVTSTLRAAATILENLLSSDLHEYDNLTPALKLRSGDAHLTELLHGQLHNRIQEARWDLTKFAY